MDHHSFTIRLPQDIVVEVGRRAQKARRSRNEELISLLRLGLSEGERLAMDFDAAVRAFVFRQVTPEELQQMMDPR